jgi:DNA-binding NarL/FixJ family response regulator
VTALGHTVVGAVCTGEELVELVARTRPDLALVDVHLAHGSNGLAAATGIQQRFAVPAIAMSGHLTAAEAQAAELLGRLSKPDTSACLQETLEQASKRLDGGSDKPLFIDLAS